MEILGGKARGTKAVLVRHHHEPESCARQQLQARDHARHESYLVESIDLVVSGFLDEGAIAVEEQGGAQRPVRGGRGDEVVDHRRLTWATSSPGETVAVPSLPTTTPAAASPRPGRTTCGCVSLGQARAGSRWHSLWE